MNYEFKEFTIRPTKWRIYDKNTKAREEQFRVKSLELRDKRFLE